MRQGAAIRAAAAAAMTPPTHRHVRWSLWDIEAAISDPAGNHTRGWASPASRRLLTNHLTAASLFLHLAPVSYPAGHPLPDGSGHHMRPTNRITGFPPRSKHPGVTGGILYKSYRCTACYCWTARNHKTKRDQEQRETKETTPSK